MRRASLLLSAVLICAACTGDTGGETAPDRDTAPSLSGGTLRVVDFNYYELDPELDLDPQTDYELAHWELFRCCLLRTLLSYSGEPTAKGGAEVRPDLAAGPPQVSDDGLTWTFELKTGIHYAPPFDDVEITSKDVVRALERMGDPNVNSTDPSVSNNYTFYFSVIDGFDEYRTGKAATIAGLEVSGDHTLKVHLTAPTGYLGNLFALPATAPIPDGSAEGHDSDYGSFLVASGPYMFEGAQDVDYSAPPDQQVAASGLFPGRDRKAGGWVSGRLVLVRNPSWHRATDVLRPAHPDRIEIDLGGIGTFDGVEEHFPRFVASAFDAVRDGRRDLVLDWQPPPGIATTYRDDPALSRMLRTERSNFMTFLAMNVAEPPFDDLHVRKAVSLVIDKDEIARRFAARDPFPINGVPATHVVPDSMENGLLASWAPQWVVSGANDPVAAAQAEMRRSTYDADGDGRCDDRVCRDASFAVDEFWPKEFFPSVRRDLGRIGITFTVDRVPRGTYPDDRGPDDHVALTADRWAADFPDASDFLPVLFYGPNIGVPSTANVSLLGASPEQLKAWGYEVTTVPSVDPAIDRCTALIGREGVECWTRLDQKLSDQIVPWVPIMFETRSIPVSDRVIRYSFDQFTSMPALDRIALAPGSS